MNLLSRFGKEILGFLLLGILCVWMIWWILKLPLGPVKHPDAQPVNSVYSNVFITARAAYVLDARTGKTLFSKNGYMQLPLASLTKIMTAVTALSLLPQDAIITIKPEFLGAEGDSGLFGNERWKLKDLMDLTLLESSNDGASAIAVTAGQVASVAGPMPKLLNPTLTDDENNFVSQMNKKARELRLEQTYFINSTGLDLNTSISGGYGSAHDIAKLFSYAQTKYPRMFEATRYESREFESLSSLKHVVKNTNLFVSKIPSFLGSKTGYTDLAGGNLVISFDAGPNYPIVISVLGSTEHGRFLDVLKLVYATLEYLQTNDL